MSACPFCERLEVGPLTESTSLAAAFRDGFPVSNGHTLIVPRRHEEDAFSLTAPERTEMLECLDSVRAELDREFRPDGYNIGVNAGPAAGQTIGHVHLHVIPRFDGDAPDPRGGIRWVLPNRAAYWDE